MKIGEIDTKNKVMIIAEIGNNHEGSYTLAEEMIGLASESGADAVKFQTIIPEKLVSIKQTERINQLKRFKLSYEQFTKLSKFASKQGVIFLSTPFDIDSAVFLDNLVPVFKIASGDNDFYPLIQTIARTGKPIIMSTGLMNFEEIEKTALFIKNIWKVNNIEQELALLHCVSSYPTPREDANLSAINVLKQVADIVGYSDHTLGVEAAVLSVAFGARIIEKHFTIDNNFSDFHDHKLSLNPSNFKKMVCLVRNAEKMIGVGKKIPSRSEKESKQNIRRSIIANQNLSAGHKLKLENLGWVRPGLGVEPGKEKELIGKIIKQAVIAGEIIEKNNLI